MFVISFKVTSEAKMAIDETANDKGMAPAIFCRAVVLREVGAMAQHPRVARRVADRDLIREALGEFGRHGSNLNQIARRANTGEAAALIATELAAIRAPYEATLRALVRLFGVGDSA